MSFIGQELSEHTIREDSEFVLSPNQERVWFLQKLSKNQYPLVVSGQIVLDRNFNTGHLIESLDELLDRFPELGLVVSGKNGLPDARIHRFAAQDILSHESLPNEADLFHRIQELNQRPFDLENEPLLRIGALHLPPSQTTILITAHQILLGRHGLQAFSDAFAQLLVKEPTQAVASITSLLPPTSSDEHRTWWQQQLDSVSPLEFPIDKLRPPVQNFERYAYDFELDDAAALMAFAAAQNQTAETVLLGAFAALLHRYTNSNDLVFGWNTQPDENLVPLRVPIQASMTFAALTKHMQSISSTSLERQMPFATLLDSVSVERDLSRAPLVQIAFCWAGEVINHLPMIKADLLDFQLVGYQRNGKICFRFEYDATIFERDSIERIAEHFLILLVSTIKEPQTPILDLPLMSDDEYEMLLVSWNDTAVAYPHDQCLHHLIEEQVKRTPHHIAAIHGDEQITYAELNQRANQFAHYLQSIGIQPDDLVGVHLNRTIDMLVIVLAVMKSGGGYVPLDPNFPRNRLNIIVEDAHIKALITHSSIRAYAPDCEAQIILIDHIRGMLSDLPTDNPTSAVQPHNLIYVIFTSGSTGRPKGVQLEHRSVVNFLTSMQAKPGLSQDDILLAVTTLSFDIAVLELYLPLVTGAKVVIASYEDVLDGRRILELIERHNVTYLQATPATWQLMLEANWSQTPQLTALCGGETLPLELANEISQRCKALWNMYGPTEATVWSTLEPIKETPDFISIGQPINNTTIYVLDSVGKPTPIGVPGELTIGGDGVARGYFERPDLTAEKFVPDPFVKHTPLARSASALANPRMYRTGDIARYLPDGRLQFYGRIDHQVKVRGFRIELGEIETALGAYEGIKQNVVIVREDTPNLKQIVAYLISQNGTTIDHIVLRDHLKQYLPNYMIPTVFVDMEEFPLTPNGKIDRNALPKPHITAYTHGAEYVAPRNEIEAQLVKIWSQALNIPRIGIHDNFFELGGHSLLAIRIFTRIEKEFGQSLPLASLFHAPTVKDQAALLADTSQDHQESLRSGAVPIQAKGDKPPFFCVGGGVINMNNLARQLGTDQPFYALQWQSLGSEAIMHSTVEAAASTFIKAMRAIQPHGPYHLGGSFASGVIAVEIARQLEEMGEEVAQLVGFDAIVQTYTPPIKEGNAPKRSLVQKLAKRLGNRDLWGYVLRGNFKALWDRVQDNYDFVETFQYLVWKVAYKVFAFLNRPIPMWLRAGMYEEFWILNATKRHKPSAPYRGKLTLFLTPDRYEFYAKYPHFSWDDHVSGNVEAWHTPGDPCTIMLDPNVGNLADQLKTRL